MWLGWFCSWHGPHNLIPFACVCTRVILSSTAYYSEYCQGWSVGTCPNYYCEYAEVCGAEFMAVNATTGSNQIASDRCGASYLTDDEFFDHATDADVWLIPAEMDWTRFASRWDEIKAWRQGRVYEYLR